MSELRKVLGNAISDAAYGTFQIGIGTGHGAPLATELIVSPGQMLYMHTPASELRDFVDGLFPKLAKNPIADSIKGMGHRYKAGHDLLLDVPSTFSRHGIADGLKHLGHILATDFPTKAGIPIPGLSHSGLGKLLDQFGIPKAWMQLNISDAGFGFIAIAHSHIKLLSALEGHMSMDMGTALQTFGVGALELQLAMVATTNPVLMTFAGIENILAGLVATWKTFSVYVDPLDLFGAAGTSALLGFGVAHGLIGENLKSSTLSAIRSGTFGALYSVSTAFGFGAIAGFAIGQLAKALAELHNREANSRLALDHDSYRLLINELCTGNANIKPLLERAKPRLISSESRHLSSGNRNTLQDKAKVLASANTSLNTAQPTLNSQGKGLHNGFVPLPSDPSGLQEIYKACFHSSA